MASSILLEAKRQQVIAEKVECPEQEAAKVRVVHYLCVCRILYYQSAYHGYRLSSPRYALLLQPRQFKPSAGGDLGLGEKVHLFRALHNRLLHLYGSSHSIQDVRFEVDGERGKTEILLLDDLR